jgi:hypothetical protein
MWVRRFARLALSPIVGAAALVACSGTIESTPYGEAPQTTSGRKPTTSSAATTTGAPDLPAEPSGAGSSDPDNAAAPSSPTTTDASSPTTVDDAGAMPAARPAPPAPTCTPKGGPSCEDCCFASVAGGTALEDRINQLYNDCMAANGCIDASCEDFCFQQSNTDACVGQQGVCDQVDACIARIPCY